MTLRGIGVTQQDGTNAVAIAELRNAAADRLTETFGKGQWSGHCSARGVMSGTKRGAVVFAAARGDVVVGTMTLTTRKPWAIDPAYFTPVTRPLHLINMAVHPDCQRQGIGRLLLEHARTVTAGWPADAVRLDAFDGPAGAGPFYARCGFAERGRRIYRAAPLIYYEYLI